MDTNPLSKFAENLSTGISKLGPVATPPGLVKPEPKPVAKPTIDVGDTGIQSTVKLGGDSIKTPAQTPQVTQRPQTVSKFSNDPTARVQEFLNNTDPTLHKNQMFVVSQAQNGTDVQDIDAALSKFYGDKYLVSAPEQQPIEETPGLGSFISGAGKQLASIPTSMLATITGDKELGQASIDLNKAGNQESANALPNLNPVNAVLHPVETAKGVGKGVLSTVQDTGGMVQNFAKNEYGFIQAMIGNALGDKAMQEVGMQYAREGQQGKTDIAIPEQYTKALNPSQALGKSVESVMELLLPFLDQKKVAKAFTATGGDISKLNRAKGLMAKPATSAEIATQAEIAIGKKVPQEIKNAAEASVPKVEIPSRGTPSQPRQPDLRGPLSELNTATTEHKANLYAKYSADSDALAAAHKGEDLSGIHNDVKNGITDVLDKYGIRRATASEIKKGSDLYIGEGSKLNPTEVQQVGSAVEQIRKFPVKDAQSFVRMNQRFGTEISNSSGQAKQVLTDIWKKALVEPLKSKIPELSALNQAYGEGLDLSKNAMKLLDEGRLGKLTKDFKLTQQDILKKLETATGKDGKILKPTLDELNRFSTEKSSIKARQKLMSETEKSATQARAAKVNEQAQKMTAAQKRALELKIEEITAKQPKLRDYLKKALGLTVGGGLAGLAGKELLK